MRVSVVVNNHNYADYLAQAVDSALAQEWPDVETIVVDDGSADHSLDVLHTYRDRIRVVRQANRGQTAACAAGLAASSGEIVILLDADDVLLPGAAGRAVRSFWACPDAVRVSWPLWEVDAEGVRTGALRPPQRLDRGDLRRRVLTEGPDCYIAAPTSGNAWSRSFLREVLPAADEDRLRLGTDGYLSTLAPLFGLVEVIDEPQSLYRVHGENGYWRASLESRVTALLGWYGPRVEALVAVARRLGTPVEEGALDSPYYSWLRRLDVVIGELRNVLPPTEPFLLLDNGEWGERLLADRPHLPFTERGGVYWGPPADDAAAVAELRRQAARGIRHVVVGWPAFWYLDCYPGMLGELEPVHRSDDVHVYRVRVRS